MIKKIIQSWLKNEEGVAVMEAAMLFPVILVLLMGVYDLGNGIALAEKSITSSQIAADLVSRNRTMNAADLDDLIEGAKLAFEPYDTHDFGIDVVSVAFDQNKDPVILWRETRDMLPNNVAVASVAGLAPEGEGMIIVTVKYAYTPMFSKFFTDDIGFSEVAFARGRRSPTVVWED